jgi:hypothetical protein
VIVVCHEKPEIRFTHSQISYVEVDFPPPDPDRYSKILDRAQKELIGLISASQFGESHILKMDADDCISKHIAAYVNQHPKQNGWYFRKGYVYTDGDRRIYLRRGNFYEWCGTCNIVRSDLFDIVRENVKLLPRETEEYLKYYIKHADVPKKMEQRGTPLDPFPFPAATYILGHGENSHPNSASSKLINPKGAIAQIKSRLINFRPLTLNIRNEFGLYNID